MTQTKEQSTIDDILRAIESTTAMIKATEAQKAAAVQSARSATDDNATIEWVSLNQREQFLRAYMTHLAGPVMDAAKVRRIAEIRAVFDELLPEYQAAGREMAAAHADYGRLTQLIRTNATEPVFIERTQALEAASAVYGALQRRLIPM